MSITHTLDWEISWIEEPGGLQSIGHCCSDLAQHIKCIGICVYVCIHMYIFPRWCSGKEESAFQTEDARDTDLIPGLRRSLGGGLGNPLQDSCLENPMGREAWRAIVHEVEKVRYDWAFTYVYMYVCVKCVSVCCLPTLAFIPYTFLLSPMSYKSRDLDTKPLSWNLVFFPFSLGFSEMICILIFERNPISKIILILPIIWPRFTHLGIKAALRLIFKSLLTRNP